MKKEKRARITSGTKEWATYTVNCMSGCYHNCRYCYAKMIAKRFKRHTDRSWKNMRTNKYAVAKEYGKKNVSFIRAAYDRHLSGHDLQELEF